MSYLSTLYNSLFSQATPDEDPQDKDLERIYQEYMVKDSTQDEKHSPFRDLHGDESFPPYKKCFTIHKGYYMRIWMTKLQHPFRMRDYSTHDVLVNDYIGECKRRVYKESCFYDIDNVNRSILFEVSMLYPGYACIVQPFQEQPRQDDDGDAITRVCLIMHVNPADGLIYVWPKVYFSKKQ